MAVRAKTQSYGTMIIDNRVVTVPLSSAPLIPIHRQKAFKQIIEPVRDLQAEAENTRLKEETRLAVREKNRIRLKVKMGTLTVEEYDKVTYKKELGPYVAVTEEFLLNKAESKRAERQRLKEIRDAECAVLSAKYQAQWEELWNMDADVLCHAILLNSHLIKKDYCKRDKDIAEKYFEYGQLSPRQRLCLCISYSHVLKRLVNQSTVTDTVSDNPDEMFILLLIFGSIALLVFAVFFS